MSNADRDRCTECGAMLDDQACARLCKGCRQPERVEAMLAERKDSISQVVLHLGRRFGVLPGRDDDPFLRRPDSEEGHS